MIRFVKSFVLFLLYIVLTPYTAMSYNPCDEIPLGIYSCPTHGELWNGSNVEKTTNCLCPPYNKTDRGGCLKQFDLPGPWDIIYNRYCAEESSSTNFFTPKIHVRVQTCNFGCWTLSEHLRGDGECTIFPGSFGLPLLRLCARIALPDDPLTPTPADDGYTYGWHLNYEGAPELDPVYTGDDNHPVYMARPKVCAYWDPSFWDALANYAAMSYRAVWVASGLMINAAVQAGVTPSLVQEFMASTGVDTTGLSSTSGGTNVLRTLQATFQPDLWDLNPVRQSMHFHQGGIFIMAQWLISLFKLGLSGAKLINSLIGMMPGDSMWYVYGIGVLYWLLVAVVYIGEEIIIPALEYLGQLNNVVTAALGCVLVPLGPNPPPYCNPLSPPLPIPKIYEICPTILVQGNATTELMTIPASPIKPCVSSTVPNNVINNSVRIAFDELIPLCKNTEIPSDRCVKIHGSLVPSSMHALTSSLQRPDLLKICSGPSPGNSEIPCAESPALLTKCRQNTAWCNQGIRVVYAINAGSNPLINGYFDTTASDCTPLSNSMCQKIWGVNIGDFKDLTVLFPTVESSYKDVEQKSASVVLRDSSNSTVGVYASIARKKVELNSLTTIDPTEICVFDSFNNFIGCAMRPVPPKPRVYECGAPGTRATCSSTHFNPTMIAKLQIDTYSTEGPLSTLTSRGTGSKINLAGFDYDSFATDANYSTKPFSGGHSINPSSIYGNYKNDQAPYDANGANPTNAIYLNGLEYTTGKYVVGGEQLCLSGYKFDDCLTGKTNTSCVLTSIVNSNYVRCTKFYNDVMTRYNGITLCNPSQLASYSQITVLEEPRVSPATGTNNITIYRETASSGRYCYDYTGSASGELCRTGYSLDSRVSPPSSHVNPLNDTDYYNYNKTININGDVLAVRNKTAIEFGLCVDVPAPPPCQITTENNARWPQSAFGIARGVCVAGAMPKGTNSLNRYCTIDKNSGQSVWEPINSTMGCKQGCSIAATGMTGDYNASTKILNFASWNLGTGIYTGNLVFNLSSMDSVNVFKLVNAGADDSIKIVVNGTQVSAGPNGRYYPGVEFSRVNSASPDNLDLKPYLHVGQNNIEVTISVVGGGGGGANFYVDIAGCPNPAINPPSCAAITSSNASTNGWATWAEVPGDTYSQGTCVTGAIPISGTLLQRVCNLNGNTSSFAEIDPTTDGCLPVCAVKTNFATATYTNSTKNMHLETPLYSPGISKKYDFSFKFHVQDINALNSLILKNLYYGDFILIKLNGNTVFVGGDRRDGPDGNSITKLELKSGTCNACGGTWYKVEYNNNGDTACANTCDWWDLSPLSPAVNLKNFLVNGENEIAVTNVGANNFRVKMDLEYDINGCTMVTPYP